MVYFAQCRFKRSSVIIHRKMFIFPFQSIFAAELMTWTRTRKHLNALRCLILNHHLKHWDETEFKHVLTHDSVPWRETFSQEGAIQVCKTVLTSVRVINDCGKAGLKTTSVFTSSHSTQLCYEWLVSITVEDVHGTPTPTCHISLCQHVNMSTFIQIHFF